jgi:16S rRNA processing protein RimM
MENGQLVVGFIRGSYGVTGECKVESASGEYDHIAALTEVTLQHGTEQKICRVESVDLKNGGMCIKLAGIDTPEDVRKYCRWEIVVPRKYAKPLKEGEWYIDDLRKCSLVYENENGPAAMAAPAEKVGTITDVLEGGVGYLFEVSLSESCTLIADNVKLTAAGKPRSVLVPFTKEHIGKIDIGSKTVQLMHLWILE